MPPFLETGQHFVTVSTNQVQQKWCSEPCNAKELKTLLTGILALIIFVGQVSSLTALSLWCSLKDKSSHVEMLWKASEMHEERERDVQMVPSLLNLTSHYLHPSSSYSVSNCSRAPEPQQPGWFLLKFLTYRHPKSKSDRYCSKALGFEMIYYSDIEN